MLCQSWTKIFLLCWFCCWQEEPVFGDCSVNQNTRSFRFLLTVVWQVSSNGSQHQLPVDVVCPYFLEWPPPPKNNNNIYLFLLWCSPKKPIALSAIILGLVMVGRAAFVFPLSFLSNLSKKEARPKISFKQQVSARSLFFFFHSSAIVSLWKPERAKLLVFSVR